MKISKKKLSLLVIVINTCIVGFCFSITYLIKLKDFVNFLTDYGLSVVSIENLELMNDIELLNKLIKVSRGETEVVVKLSLDLIQKLDSLLLLNAALFILLLSISLLMLLAYSKKKDN
ncbi:hypothetical protein [Colwellia sp. RSH04]|uniref:hypothetical protein n=1 Tax=Colwellia sp. RSH04 TaxID=2305464 RepID=UPI000E58BC02|nr:hypothetical protein [Colwellia sp. RSH04]RHW77452.1 hypothetical protein D1094_00385 [Colwellia sp. RSH04]